MNNEMGRSSTEILAVLAIGGLLSVGGLMWYSRAMERHNIDNILDTLQQKTIEIHSTSVAQQITNEDELNAYLEKFTTTVGAYKVSFHAAPEKDGSFVSEITNKDGSRLKGSFCRKLITTMAEQRFVSDVGFSLKDEPQEDGTTKDMEFSLRGKAVNLEGICGG